MPAIPADYFVARESLYVLLSMTETKNLNMSNVVIITGGAGGMGFATAKLMAADHIVVLSDVNSKRLESAANELRGFGSVVHAAICDVSERSEVDELFQQASQFGCITAVVHTAGLSPQMADPRTILRVNALGTVNIADASLDIASEGFALVNVSSMSAHMLPSFLRPRRIYPLALRKPETFLNTVSGLTNLMPNDFYRRGMAYAFSKDFVIWISRHRAADFGKKGARVLSVSPGSFDTEMGRLEEKSGSAEMLKTAALKRFGRPEEIAHVLAFCASEKASYLTGIDLLCDGGVIAGRG
jgi:NAD(P)-dependent dehydrogenase (short-subunit alcohol dehydrogenase family)